MNNSGNSEITNLKSKLGAYPAYFHSYIKLVEEDDIKIAIKNQAQKIETFFNSITEEQSLYQYADGKWTIKEVLQHIIDAERIFSYRALAFARKDVNILPSFDEDEYAANSNANNRSWKELVEEFIAVRKSTEFLFDSFSDHVLTYSGKASDYSISVLALGYTIAGHAEHHINIIRERYIAV